MVDLDDPIPLVCCSYDEKVSSYFEIGSFYHHHHLSSHTFLHHCRDCPRRVGRASSPIIVNHSSFRTLFTPFSVLKTSIMSPLILLSFNVVNPASCSFSSYVCPRTSDSARMSLSCTRSNGRASTSVQGHQADAANSSRGLTKVLNRGIRVLFFL